MKASILSFWYLYPSAQLQTEHAVMIPEEILFIEVQNKSPDSSCKPRLTRTDTRCYIYQLLYFIHI